MAWVYSIGVGEYFSWEEQKPNANEFYNFFRQKGVSIEAICGMLGNISRESTLNPGIKQTSSEESGWGLIQWTPSTVLTNWAVEYGYEWYDGVGQCDRIWSEGKAIKGAGGQWLPTSAYPYSWEEFIALTSVAEATKAFLYERERAGVEALDDRLKYADDWYYYFQGHPVPVETNPMPFIYYLRNRRRR